MHATDYLLFRGWVFKRMCAHLPPCTPVDHFAPLHKLSKWLTYHITLPVLARWAWNCYVYPHTMVLFTLLVCTSLYPSHPHPPHPKTHKHAPICSSCLVCVLVLMLYDLVVVASFFGRVVFMTVVCLDVYFLLNT